MIITRKYVILLCLRFLCFLCTFNGVAYGKHRKINLPILRERNGSDGEAASASDVSSGSASHFDSSWSHNIVGNGSSGGLLPPPTNSALKVTQFYRSRLKRLFQNNLSKVNRPISFIDVSYSNNIINNENKTKFYKRNLKNGSILSDRPNLLIRPITLNNKYAIDNYDWPSHNASDNENSDDSKNSSLKYYRSNLDGFDVERRNYTRRKFNRVRPSSYDGAIDSSDSSSDGRDTSSVNYDNVNTYLNDIQSILNSTLSDDSDSLLKKYLPEEDGDSESSPSATLSSSSIPGGGVPPRGAAVDFTHHRIITPRLLHARTKRDLLDTWDTDGHANHISVGLTIGDENVVFDLYLNRDLLTKDYFEKQINDEIHNIRRPRPEDAGMCHYQGFMKERPGSWAAVSTCSGIRGIVFDGEEVHYLEPIPDVTIGASSPHYLLNHKHYLNKNLTCGYTGKPHPVTDLFHDESFSRLLRYKRDATLNGGIRGPFNANSLSRYVELILVADKTEFEKHNGDFGKIYQRCKDIANIVNALYQPLNIFIALVGVEVWNATDEVDISTDGDKTLTNFLTYRKVRLIPQHPNDNAQLLTGKVFDSGVVGKALKGPICTYQYSGGVNMDHSDSVGLVATTVAHEMGHNFGMEHDTEEDCKCPDKRCIMAPSSGTKSPSHWSSCSHEYLAISFERSMDYCLRNKPTSLFQSPVCGNGFVEPGEQCDCGLPEHCTNPCCNATSCMLFANATCATGHCCDLETCSPRPAGVECRSALHECDLPEFCSGDSEYCPNNFYKEDGQECMGGKAYCYEGMCRTHENQCRLLWGPTGKNSHDKCYSLNREGNPNGNCGYNWANKTYKKCNTDDVKCGMMHCKHFNERLEFGMESVSKVTHRFIADKNQGVIPCRVAQVDLGLDMVDPGLAPDGAKCGYKRMCVDQQCMEVASLRTHVCSCNGRGVCNNLGNCHCDVGFSWPDCLYPGLGGSVDSGPASNPNATSVFVAALFIIFLGIMPLFVIILCLVYFIRGNLKLWWLRKGRPATSRLSSMDGHSRNGRRTQSSLCVEVVAKTASGDATLDGQTSTICSDSPPSSQGSKCNSPLLNGHANGSSDKMQTQLFGKYEGFTLSPIKDKPGNGDAPLPPPLLSATKACPLSAIMRSPDSTVTNSTVQKGTWNVKSNQFHPKTIPQSLKATATTKVDISHPSLQASTNPAVGSADIISPRQPTYLNSTAAFPRVAVVSPMRRAPNRPKSVPDAATLILNQCQMSSTLSDPTSLEDGKDQSKTSTVARIASFLSKKEKSEQPSLESSHQIIQSNTLPRKAAKINRESLLQLEISHPMQLKATELPNNLVPVRPAPDPPMPSNLKPSEIKASQDKPLLGKVSWAPTVNEEEPEQSDLLRIGSVREMSVTTRPSIPKFGSMRVPRPKSLPPARPSQPPPRPPLPMIPGTPETEYFYDDCLSPPSAGAPLAAGEEEISPQEGIYATIDEESPPRDCPPPEEKKEKKSIFSLLYAKTKKKKHDKETSEPLYCNIENVDDGSSSSKEDSPVKYENSGERSSTSTEDGGLLSEIVSELVNREPQYVNTLNADDKLKNSLLKEVDSTTKLTKVDLPPSLIKSTFPQNQNDCQTAPKESKSSPDFVKKPKVASYVPYSNVKPRGVFSFFKNSSTEETSLANSAEEKPGIKGTSQSFDETNERKLYNEKVVIPTGKISVNASISVPSSLAASLAGVKAASKELSDANKRTKASLDKATADTKIIINPSSNVNNKDVNNISCTLSPASDASISVSASYTAATEVKMAPQPNIVFPPDKVLHSADKLPSAAMSKPSVAPPPSKKPSFPADKTIVNAPRGRGSGGAMAPLVGKTVGKVTSPNKGSVPAKDNVSVKSSTSADKAKPLTGSVKKPTVTAKVDSGFKGKGSSATKEKMKELSSSSLKDSTKPGVSKKVGRQPATSSIKSPVGSVASLSRNDLLAAAAKPGLQGTSHVASLQQKFEESLQHSNSAAKPTTKVLKSKVVKK